MPAPSPSMPNQDDRDAITGPSIGFQERDRSPVPGQSAVSGLGSPSPNRGWERAACQPFYIYRLIDPRDSACFYIGKGKGQRAWQHQKDAVQGTRPCNQAKHNRILAILASGMGVSVEIVANFEDERTAYAYEYDLIRTTRGLTNIIGAKSPALWPPPSPEEIRRARQIAKRQQMVRARESQYKRFVKALPDHIQATAAEWIESLKSAPQPELGAVKPSHVACPVWRYRPPDSPKRNNTRKLRRKYRPSRNLEIGPIGGIPPSL